MLMLLLFLHSTLFEIVHNLFFFVTIAYSWLIFWYLIYAILLCPFVSKSDSVAVESPPRNPWIDKMNKLFSFSVSRRMDHFFFKNARIVPLIQLLGIAFWFNDVKPWRTNEQEILWLLKIYWTITFKCKAWFTYCNKYTFKMCVNNHIVWMLLRRG